MKRTFLFLLFVAISLPAMAVDGESAGGSVVNVVVNGLGLIAIACMVAHIVYVNFLKGNSRTDYTVAEFEKNRTEASLPALTKAEIDSMNSRLDSIDDIWGEIVDSSGDMVCYPHKRSTLKRSIDIVNQVISENPADKGVVAKINEYNQIINHATSRQFNGSKAIIVIAAIVGIIMGIATDMFAPVISVVAGIVVYALASRTPNFMLIVQLAKGRDASKSYLSRLLSSLFMGVATAKTYKTVTTYSDGSKSTEIDRSEKWISLIVAIVATIVLSFLLIPIGIVNYLRNYWIYR